MLILIFLSILFPTLSYAVNSPTLISNCADRECMTPTIVADSNGIVHIVWMDAVNGWSSSTTSLVHSYWNGEIWSTPTTIDTGHYSELPTLAADILGNVYLTFDNDTNPNSWQVFYMKYNGSTWTSPIPISQDAPGYDQAWDSDLAIDSAGNPHVTYTYMPADSGNVRYTYYTKWNGTIWSEPINLTQSENFHQYPTIVADKLGKIHVAWKSTTGTNDPFNMVHRVWNGSTWSETVSVSGLVLNGVQESQPDMSIDKNDNVHIVWEESNYPTDSNYSIKYNKWTNAVSSWSTAFLVSSVAYQTVQGVPSVAVVSDTVNDVMVGWLDKSSSPFRLDFRKYNALSQQWEVERKNEIQQTSADFPVAAIDKWDNIHVAWGEINPLNNKYQVYYDAIPVATSIIGTGGGTLTTFNGDTLTFPAGSLSSNQIISAQISPLSHSAPTNNWTVPRQYIFEPTGLNFNSNMTAVFKYTDTEVTGSENTLGIYLWDTPTLSWVFKTGTVNRAQNRLTAQLDHFSSYGLFSSTDTVLWENPLSETQDNIINRGRTIPVKFRFSDSSIPNESLNLQILDESANVITDLGYSQLKLNTDKSLSVNVQTGNWKPGFYQIKVMYEGLLRDSLDLTVK